MTQVLDHGYVKLIEHWGSDERIIESARMSTGKGFISWGSYYSCYDCKKIVVIPITFSGVVKCACGSDHIIPNKGDEKLLHTLYTKGHTTPFEMCGATFEVQAPIFVFREWHRHRTQSYNEFSARYSELPDLTYFPSRERLQLQSKTNKQGSEGEISDFIKTDILSKINEVYDLSRQTYENLLELGLAKEIARLVIPVSQYSKMRASSNLLNWIRFLRLRLPENAQWEIRQYANVIRAELEGLYPQTMELFNEEMRGKQ